MVLIVLLLDYSRNRLDIFYYVILGLRHLVTIFIYDKFANYNDMVQIKCCQIIGKIMSILTVNLIASFSMGIVVFLSSSDPNYSFL